MTRLIRRDSTSSRARRYESATTPPTWNASPSIDACSSRRRSSGSSRSSRAASRAWIAGGTAISPTAVLSLGEQREHLLEKEWVALRGRRDPRLRPSAADRPLPGGRRSAREDSSRRERLEEQRGARSACRHPRPAAPRAARAGRGRSRERERHAPSRPGTRSDRAASARPSACPRTPARAG